MTQRTFRRWQPEPGSTPHPGDTLREILDEKDIPNWQLAQAVGISEKHLSRILCGKSGYSPDLAIKMGDALNVSPELLWNLLAGYQYNQALWRALHGS